VLLLLCPWTVIMQTDRRMFRKKSKYNFRPNRFFSSPVYGRPRDCPLLPHSLFITYAFVILIVYNIDRFVTYLHNKRVASCVLFIHIYCGTVKRVVRYNVIVFSHNPIRCQVKSVSSWTILYTYVRVHVWRE